MYCEQEDMTGARSSKSARLVLSCEWASEVEILGVQWWTRCLLLRCLTAANFSSMVINPVENCLIVRAYNSGWQILSIKGQMVKF